MDLNQLRKQINEIDNQLVDLFVQRMQIVANIATTKAEGDLPIQDMQRENMILQKVMARADADLQPYLHTLYHTIFDMSRSYQMNLLQEAKKKENKI